MDNNFQEFEMMEVTDRETDLLAGVLTEWQKTSSFNDFLKESPGSFDENGDFVSRKLGGENAYAQMAIFSKKIVGIIFLHGFDKQDGSLEETIRIAPDLQRKGIGTQMKRRAFQDAFHIPGVRKIISWHSAWNKGTFFTNMKCGGKIVDFIENQTFLPNINKTTDDFKWEITKILDNPELKDTMGFIDSRNDIRIRVGLRKHGLIS